MAIQWNPFKRKWLEDLSYREKEEIKKEPILLSLQLKKHWKIIVSETNTQYNGVGPIFKSWGYYYQMIDDKKYFITPMESDPEMSKYVRDSKKFGYKTKGEAEIAASNNWDKHLHVMLYKLEQYKNENKI